MTWLTWRQFRTQAVVTAAVLVALAALLVTTGVHLSHLYADSGIRGCTRNCSTLVDSFLDQARNGLTGTIYTLTGGIPYVVPAVVGIFWGAPLIARELETGTYRLVWNQSVSRGRWLAAKLFGVGLATIVTAGLLAVMVNWWASPIDRASLHRMTPDVFGARGITLIGYAAFAFALGVTAGVLSRRTVVAMAITLAVVLAALIAVPIVVRPHLMTPVHATSPLNVDKLRSLSIQDRGAQMRVITEPNVAGAWILSNTTVTSEGKLFTGPADPTACTQDSSPKVCLQWIATLHLRQSLTYQPDSRFWALQWRETALLLALAALLAGVSVWWVRRRLI